MILVKQLTNPSNSNSGTSHYSERVKYSHLGMHWKPNPIIGTRNCIMKYTHVSQPLPCFLYKMHINIHKQENNYTLHIIFVFNPNIKKDDGLLRNKNKAIIHSFPYLCSIIVVKNKVHPHSSTLQVFRI